MKPQNKIQSIYHRKVTHREEKTEFGRKGRVESSGLPRRILFQIAGTLCTKLRGNKTI